MELKYAIRKFLKTKGTSDAVEELTEMFLIPFYQNVKSSRVTPEQAVDSFFCAGTRKMFFAKARRAFRMPGGYVDPSNERTTGNGNRMISEGRVMLCVADSVDKTTKIMVRARDKFDEFILNEAEMNIVDRIVDVL